MTDLLATTLLGIPLSNIVVVGTLAVIASVIGGVSGYGSGLLLPLALVPAIGAEATVPVLGVAAILTNAGRMIAFRDEIAWPMVWRVAMPAAPAVIVGAGFNASLSGPGVLILLGLTLLAMVPLRRWIAERRLTLQATAIIPAAFVIGLLLGGTTGAGVLLIAAFGGLGLAGASLIATEAAASMLIGLVKSASFGAFGALTAELFIFAIFIGLATIPGAFVARAILERVPLRVHAALMDSVVTIGGLTLLWRGIRG